jgi:hypothetical protein
MAVSKKIFRFFVFLLMTSFIAAVPVFSQPPGGGDQSQQTQGSQMGQQGTQAGGQTQQGGRGFGQMSGQGQQAGQMQDMITQRLKQLMGTTDDEWTIIGPKVLKVVSLASSQSRGFQMRSLMGNSNQQGNPTQGTSSQNNPNQGSSSQGASNQGNFQGRGMGMMGSTSDNKTLEELQTLTANKAATTAQIKEKMNEVRREKEESRQKLAKAQKELRELLSLRQEAVLVSVGLLD